MKIITLTLALASFAAHAGPPIIVDSETGKYLGTLSANPYAPDSVNNRFGKYGSPYSPDSINNPYGKYGNPYSPNSVNNKYSVPVMDGRDYMNGMGTFPR